MTGYERCVVALEGGTPDRVPGYTPTLACEVASRILGRDAVSGTPSLWHAEAMAWLAGETAHAEFEAQLLEDRLELHRALGNDIFRFPWRGGVRPTAQIDDQTFLCGDRDGVHQVWRWDTDVQNFICVRNTAPPVQPEDWPRLARERESGLDESVAFAREHSGVAEAAIQKRLGDSMMMVAGGGSLSMGVSAEPLMAIALFPGAVADILDCQLAVALAQAEGLASRGIRVMHGGGDMADKNGPIYSPEAFRALLLPRLKKLSIRCKELGLHYVWRTDGKTWRVSDMIFTEASIEAYGEVDYDAGMTMASVRERYPELAVWGNVSADLLRRGTSDEVYEHSMEILTASEGRGHFHGCSNAILAGTPEANVWAMMQARDDFARG